MQQTLFLRRLRDFGEKTGDTFLFLKQNWKNLFSIYAIFVVPFIILAVVMGLMFAHHLNSLSSLSFLNLRASDIFTPDFFILLLSLLMASNSFNTAVYSYFRLYDQQKGDRPTLQQVGQLYFRKFLPVFFYSFLMVILLTLAAIVPAMIVIFVPLLGLLAIFGVMLIYLTILLHMNCILVAEDGGLATAISRMFFLFRNRWWPTIGYTVVIFIIYYIFSFAIQMVFTLVFGALSVNFLPTHFGQTPVNSGNILNATVLLMGGMFLLQQLFYLVVFCGVGISYYSLAEEKDGSAIEEQIESIGDDSDKFGGVEEQY